MEPKMTAIIPLEQALIPLAGHNFLVAKLPDRHIAAIFSHFCEALTLDRWGQVKRILAHRILAKSLLLVRVETPGGPQEAYAIAAWAIPVWLNGVQTSRLAEEKRELIFTLQEEAVDTFYRYFFESSKQEPPPSPKEPVTEPPPRPAVEPPEEEPFSHWQMLYAGFSGLEQEQEMQNIQMAGMRARLTALEAGAAQATPAQAATHGAALTPAHQAQVWAFLRALQRQTGLHLAVIEEELFARFGGQRVSQLPESAWQEVLLWFWRRLGW